MNYVRQTEKGKAYERKKKEYDEFLNQTFMNYLGQKKFPTQCVKQLDWWKVCYQLNENLDKCEHYMELIKDCYRRDGVVFD